MMSFFITSSSLFYQIDRKELDDDVPHFYVKFRWLLTSPPRHSKMKFHLVGVKRPNNFFHVFLPRDSSQGSSFLIVIDYVRCLYISTGTRNCYPTATYQLTLRGLSLFFIILPISNTGDSIAYILATVHFRYPKLGSFSDMEYYFYQLAYRDSKVPKRFVGLNQMQCSPSFDWNWGKQNDPTACWHQLHPRFRVL